MLVAETVSPMKNTLNFLKDLKEHNEKTWFTNHKKDFELAKAEISDLGIKLAKEMLQHDNIDPKVKLFRIYRDVRFSKDKTPYKTSLSGSMKRNTPALRGGYYFHIEPGNSFLAGGFWGPEPKDLLHLRQQIQQDAAPLRAVIEGKDFQQYFGELKGERVKSAPKGFAKDDPNIDLIRYKGWIAEHSFTDAEVVRGDFHEVLNDGFKKMRPFFDVMSEYLTTDLNGESLI